MAEEQASAHRGRVDAAIITIRQDEHDVVVQRLENARAARGRRLYTVGSVRTVSGRTATVFVHRLAEQGNGPAQDAARDVIEDLDPNLIAVVGIGGGVPSWEVTLGDVVVAVRLADLRVQALRYEDRPQLEIRGERVHKGLADLLANLPRQATDTWSEPDAIGVPRPPAPLEKKRFEGPDASKRKTRQIFQHHFGNPDARQKPIFFTGTIASTDSLVRNPAVLKHWMEASRKIQTVEMEAAGVFEAAARIDVIYPVLVARGTSDVVGYRREAEWTAYACHTAAAFTIGLLRSGLLDSVRPLVSRLDERSKERKAKVPREQSPQAGGDIVIVNVPGREYVGPPATAAAPAVVVPRQLPPPPADFVGREAELDEIVAAVRKGGAAISGLRGMGGIGKTALALKIGETLAPDFPDGQLYVDLKGARHASDPPEAKPLTVAEAMAYVIKSYDRTAQLPESEAELRALYRVVLAGKRALLLMDNALDREQVEPLIPPAGCVLLVTSRRNFTLPGLFAKNLDSLPPPQARELLLKIAPRIGDHADEIAKLCGYLPQALRNAAGALSERPDLSLADLVRRMSDAQQRLKLTGVELSLTVSSGLLSPDLKGRWLQLAVFPDSFDRPGAAAVWGLPPDAAQDTLGELLRYSLLEWNSASGRYRLHGPVRDFAGAQLGEAARAEAQSRHAMHYRNVLATTQRLYLQGGEAVPQGLALFDLERGNIRAGQAWSVVHAAGDDLAARLCVDYPDAGAYVLSLRLHPRERIEWLGAALGAARRLGDRGAEGNLLGGLGNAYHALGDCRRAIEFHEQARAIFREIGDRRREDVALANLGIAYYSLGDYRRAIKFHEQALAIAREIGDRRGESSALGTLGSAYYSVGEYRRAAEFDEQHLAIAREIGDRRGEGAALGNLGLAHHSLGDHRRAIEFYERQLAIAREIGDRQGEANALFNSALALAALSDRAEAIARAEAALKIYEQIESPDAATVRKALAEWRGLK
ncbi:MAG: tetratricopeptide repeat protein [Candidatus Binataceae bacterium]